jgi:hypothetical protein
MPPDNLTTADLSAGDLIVWKMGDGDANHVELFTGGSHFAATSIHAVNTPAKQMQRVMPTSFAAASYKHVFRCQRPEQVAKAVKFARQWALYENRYDKPRIDVKSAYRRCTETSTRRRRRCRRRCEGSSSPRDAFGPSSTPRGAQAFSVIRATMANRATG